MIRACISSSLRLLGLAAISTLAAIAVNTAAVGGGAWKEKTQVVWSKGSETLVRRSFQVWDPHPELDLDFLWEPGPNVETRDFAGVVNGTGTLTWHARGAANYDRRYTYSVYKGSFSNGRPEGKGALWMPTGFFYTGEWHEGEMHGRGVLRFESGDKYEGDFAAGKMHGVGKYISTDGTVYFGEFRNGARDGIGRMTLADGSYRTVWREGKEIEREQISFAEKEQPWPALRPAAISNTVKLKLSIDQKRAIEFENNDPDAESQPYDAEHSRTGMTIHLSSKAIMDAWKNNGMISSGTEKFNYMVNYWQFAPVLLKAEIENHDSGAATIKSAFLEILESSAELAPYLELHQPEANDCYPDDNYNPVLEFQNLGWEPVKDAKMTFSLGTTEKRTEDAVVKVGNIANYKKVKIESELQKFGVDIERLKKASTPAWEDSGQNREQLEQYAFHCEEPDSVDDDKSKTEENSSDDRKKVFEKCFQDIKRSGVLGRLGDFAYISEYGNLILTRVVGRLDYQWSGKGGKINSQSAPFEMSIPLIQFRLGGGEAGCTEATVRPPTGAILSLDRTKYRVDLPNKDWSMKLAAGDTKQVGFNVSAAKSSRHVFQIVVQLTDGNQVRSPIVDLTYFRPRLTKKTKRGG
jgi:hypothetical protein